MTPPIGTYNYSMGLYDRDYGRSQDPGLHLSAPQTMTMKLVLITGAIYLAQLFTGPSGFVDRYFALEPDWFRQPWKFYQLLTYGFLHSQMALQHLLYNMFGLWLFGRDIEQKYGRKEFLTFYLTAIVVAGLIWNLSTVLSGSMSGGLIGASGGVVAMTILFAFHYPHRQILFMFVIPMPMWVLGCIIVAMDAFGAIKLQGVSNVAYMAHLGGAAFAFLYYRFGLRLSSWLPNNMAMPKMQRRTKLRIHEPEGEPDSKTDKQVDEILRKINEQGQDSLTWRERKILERASREYQKKR